MPARSAEVAHHALELGRLAGLEGSRTIGLEREPIAEPVHADVQQEREGEGDDEAGAAADQATHDDQQAAQRRKQGRRS